MVVRAIHSHKKYILPKKVLFNGQTVTTAIFNDPVKGPMMLRKLNLDGDRQADLIVHGGVDKGNKLIQYAPMNVTIAIFEDSKLP